MKSWVRTSELDKPVNQRQKALMGDQHRIEKKIPIRTQQSPSTHESRIARPTRLRGTTAEVKE
jgi:hypothetical protein